MKYLRKKILYWELLVFFSSFSFMQLFATAPKETTAINPLFYEAVNAYDKGNYDEALNLFEKFYSEESNKHGEDQMMLGDILLNIGSINVQLRLYDKAIVYYLKADSIYSAKNNLMKMASIQANLAICYFRNSDMEKARSYYENADRIFKQLRLENSSEYEYLMNNLSSFHADNFSYKKALEYNDKAFKISTILRKEYFKWGSRGYIYYKIKDYSKSIACYNMALKTMERDHRTDYSEKDRILTNLGQVYLELNNFDKSLDYFNRSRIFISKTSGPVNASYSLCLNNIGQVYQKRSQTTNDLDKFLEKRKNDLFTALEYYQQAMCALSPGYKNLEISENPKIENVIDKTPLLISLKNKAEALRELAELEEKTGDRYNCIKHLNNAIKTYQLSNKVIHLIRTGFIDQGSRLFLAENEHSFYIGAIKAGVKLFELTQERKYFEQAFEFSERSRSTDFLTMVRNTRAKQIGGMPDSLLQRETELNSQIAAYKNFVFDESNKTGKDFQKVNRWKTKIFNLEQSYAKLISHFEKEYPKYYNFKYDDPIIPLKEVESKLEPREALIEYVVQEPENDKKGEIFIFMVTRNRLKIFRKDIDTSYENSINSILQFLKTRSPYNTRKTDYLSYSSNAFKLNNLLISPFSKQVDGYRLIIIPDGKLSYLPFDAFLSSAPDSTRMDFRSLKYLVYNHAISYAYSATLLYYDFNDQNRSPQSLGAFLPNYIPKSNEQLFSLPGARIEVAGISKLINSEIFDDKEATKQNFKNQAGDFDILHLAMHTIINDSLPMYSKLVFSPDLKGNKFLNTYEIYNMNLQSRLVVLSACNTGSGKLAKGEGVMSLARAFLYAGCPSILMTLWNVEDDSSAKLMIDFYKNLLNGYSKDEALRKSKLKHIQNCDPLQAHPYYWLGYVSIGDQHSLFQTKVIYLIAMISFILLIIIIEKFNRWFKNRKQQHFKNPEHFIKNSNHIS